MTFSEFCAGCGVSQGSRHPTGGALHLPGGWVVNQYGGSEGWLGWLALQPAFHRMSLSELSAQEAQTLGPNIQTLDRAVTAFWQTTYPRDPVMRVYVVYFFESAFEMPKEPTPYHLHIHLIPRFQSLNTPNGLQRSDGKTTWADGWRVPTLRERGAVPLHYLRGSEDWEQRVAILMAYIRDTLV